ncbi:MAG: hypothetical protein HYW10_06725 [Candidatus Omnitrophica bacterium]|nr:hypothetical protein [Candidatus Omnitrophota bacterium]
MASQRTLCQSVLERLAHAGVLEDVVLIGSWCLEGYMSYFGRKTPLTALRTRDIDFLVPRPTHLRNSVDVPALLEDLGFVVDFHRGGYIRLLHPELIVEFLVPERGRGTDHPVRLPQLKVNAQALRFLNLLADSTITATLEGIQVRMPHPAAFALQKLLIAPRRQGRPSKQAKDLDAAVAVLEALRAHGENESVREHFESMPPRWQARIRQILGRRQELRVWLELLGG